MDARTRQWFNRSYTPDKYADFLSKLDRRCGTHVTFRNCETPCFLSTTLMGRLVTTGEELIRQLVSNPDYLAAADAAVPAEYRAPGESARPLFICVDFGLTHDHSPKLVEIQGFPSLYAFQPALAETYREVYGVPGASLLADDYWRLLRRAIVGGHPPEDVALLEIDPYHQKTLPDFLLTREQLGIRIVNVMHVEKRGRKLYADSRPIERIYNRAIVDELVRKGLTPAFSFGDELDVEWAGHPNWYFRISKFSLPYLKHASVPRTMFLNQVTSLPHDLDNWVLKPLYSFAGLGVKIGPTRADIESVADPTQYILQERVDFAPLIETPHGPTKAEIRVMYVWLDERPRAVTTIVRMGRGKMMGVDHNKDMEWVGASAGFVV
jgi:hypothetical protein